MENNEQPVLSRRLTAEEALDEARNGLHEAFTDLLRMLHHDRITREEVQKIAEKVDRAHARSFLYPEERSGE